MKYAVGQRVTDLKGKLVKDADSYITYGDLMSMCVLGQYPDDAQLTMEAKLKRFKLAQKIIAAATDTVELEDVETVEIKKCATKFLTIPMLGLLVDFLANPLPKEQKGEAELPADWRGNLPTASNS